MKIAGLSNQWRTREGLYGDFLALPSEDPTGEIRARHCRIRQLFDALESRDGPEVFVGTSHALMNFCNRDVVREYDRTPPFAYVEVVGSPVNPLDLRYRVVTRRIQQNRPTADWVTHEVKDTVEAVDLIRNALEYADVPVRAVRR